MSPQHSLLIGETTGSGDLPGKRAVPFRLPTEAVTATLVVYGGKGMGKTNFGRRFVEQLAACRLRFSLIDPVGVSWGIRHSADGNGPGIANVLVLGGLHADIPIQPTAGAVVADLVADEHVNTLIDISRKPNGQLWTVGEKVRFVTDYALRLYQRQGEKREPIMVILDEAARYIPQMIPAGNLDLAKCVGAWEMLTEEGRNVGIGVTFLTQRSARMNKSVSELADAMIAFRTVGPRSIDAILDWFGEHVPKERWKAYIEQLRQLPIGQALVVSPGWLGFEGTVNVALAETFDSSSTPRPGESARAPRGKAATVDKAKYEQRMAETIAAADANDPAKLRAKVTELTSQLERAVTAGERALAHAERPPEVRIEKVVERVPYVPPKAIEMVAEARKAAAEFEEHLARLAAYLDKPASDAEGIRAAIHALAPPSPSPAAQEPRQPAARPSAPAVLRVPSGGVVEGSHVSFPTGDTNLRSGERKMLDVLARSHPIRLTEAQLGTLARFARKGGTFGAYMRTLKRLGLVEKGSDDLLTITALGLSTSGVEPGNPLSAEEVREQYRKALRAGERTMFDELVAVYPDGLSPEELGRRAGFEPTGGTFGAYVRTLRRNGLVITAGDVIQATPTALGQL